MLKCFPQITKRCYLDLSSDGIEFGSGRGPLSVAVYHSGHASPDEPPLSEGSAQDAGVQNSHTHRKSTVYQRPWKTRRLDQIYTMVSLLFHEFSFINFVSHLTSLHIFN